MSVKADFIATQGNWRGSYRQASTSSALTSDVPPSRLCLSLLPMTEVVPQVGGPVTYKSLQGPGRHCKYKKLTGRRTIGSGWECGKLNNERLPAESKQLPLGPIPRCPGIQDQRGQSFQFSKKSPQSEFLHEFLQFLKPSAHQTTCVCGGGLPLIFAGLVARVQRPRTLWLNIYSYQTYKIC